MDRLTRRVGLARAALGSFEEVVGRATDSADRLAPRQRMFPRMHSS